MISAKRIFRVLLAASPLLLASCATTKPPIDELGAASRMLAAARSAGAATYAPADYRSASQRLDQAQSAEGRHDYDAATQLANESAADGELATARARVAKAREAVERLKQQNASLEQGLGDQNTQGFQEVQP